MDDRTLDTEEASKTGSEEKTRDEANGVQQGKKQADEASGRRKPGKQPGHLATDVNKN